MVTFAAFFAGSSLYVSMAWNSAIEIAVILPVLLLVSNGIRYISYVKRYSLAARASQPRVGDSSTSTTLGTQRRGNWSAALTGICGGLLLLQPQGKLAERG